MQRQEAKFWVQHNPDAPGVKDWEVRMAVGANTAGVAIAACKTREAAERSLDGAIRRNSRIYFCLR